MKEPVPETPEVLLLRFAQKGDEAAFQDLVRRRLPFVYHAALRQLDGDGTAAREVAFGVFADLALKASSVAQHPSLVGWLFTATRQRTSNLRRADARRRSRELQAAELMSETTSSNSLWNELRPFVDDALAELPEADRVALLGRYFEEQPHARLGDRWGVSENAARMRVDRAADRLRSILERRGITSTTLAIGAALGSHAYGAEVPHELAATVTIRSLENLASIQARTAMTPRGSGLAKAWVFSAVTGIVLVGLLISILTKSHETRVTNPGPVANTESPGLRASESPSAGGLSKNRGGDVPISADASNGFAVKILNLDFRDENGQPIADVRLKFSHFGPMGIGTGFVTNNGSGRALIEFPANTTRLEIASLKEGWGDMLLRWDAARHDSIPGQWTANLEPGVPFGGVVTGEDGRGIAGVNVRFDGHLLSSEPDEKGFRSTLRHLEITTDSEGRWETRRIPKSLSEKVRLTFDRDFFELSASHHPEARGEERTKELAAAMSRQHQAKMVRSSQVTGWILDESGQPVEGARVMSSDPRTINFCPSCIVAVSKADGRFRLAPNGGGDTIFVEATGWPLGGPSGRDENKHHDPIGSRPLAGIRCGKPGRSPRGRRRGRTSGCRNRWWRPGES